MSSNNIKSNDKKGLYFKLFTTFFKIGAFTFGGGYAMIPLIQRETTIKNHWIDDKDILDIVAVAESTPGPIAINSATFVGYKVAGNFGALCATIGVVLPSFFIILTVSVFLSQFENFKAVKYAFYGIRAGVLALIVNAVISMYKACPHNLVSYILIALSFLTAAVFNVSVLFIIIGCALLGLITFYVTEDGRRKMQ